VNVIKALDI